MAAAAQHLGVSAGSFRGCMALPEYQDELKTRLASDLSSASIALRIAHQADRAEAAPSMPKSYPKKILLESARLTAELAIKAGEVAGTVSKKVQLEVDTGVNTLDALRAIQAVYAPKSGEDAAQGKLGGKESTSDVGSEVHPNPTK